MIHKILIAGGSGLIGRRLTALLLHNGYAVAWLSRKQQNIFSGVHTYIWNTESMQMDVEAIRWADAIVNLSGEGIADKRWTKARKKIITGSRIKAAELLAKALEENKNKVQCVIASAAVGYYGDNGGKWINEVCEAGSGFLSISSMQWEEASHRFENMGLRVLLLRIGIVLSSQGGALPELKKTLPFGLAPVLGNGKQYYSWMHIDDVCGFIMYALKQENLSGTFNVCTDVITQKEMMQEMQRVFGKFSFRIPVPVFILRLMLGEMADTVLISQRVSSNKLLQTGYPIKFNTLPEALINIYNTKV